MAWRIGETLNDGRCRAASAERNRDPILTVLERVLPERGLVLEIGSGTGQHIVHFARALPRLVWQPTDVDAELRRSVSAWIAQQRCPTSMNLWFWTFTSVNGPSPKRRRSSASMCCTLPLGRRRRRCSQAQPEFSQAVAFCTYTAPIAAAAVTPLRATSDSMRSSGRSIRSGECAISRMFNRPHRPPALPCPKLPTCRRTT